MVKNLVSPPNIVSGANVVIDNTKSTKSIITSFDSIYAWMEQTAQHQVKLSSMNSSHNCDSGFTGVKTISEIEKHYFDKWEPLQQMADNNEIDIQPHDYDLAPDFVPDVVGGACDMAEYLSGNPECMSLRQPNITESLPVVNFVMNAGMPHYVSVQDAIRYRVQVAGVITDLENMGIRCGLFVYMASEASSYRHEVLISVKAPTQLINLPSALTVMCHPGTLRMLGFSWKEQVAAVNSDFLNSFRGGYGRPAEAPKKRFPKDSSYIYIPSMGGSNAKIVDIVRNNKMLQKILKID